MTEFRRRAYMTEPGESLFLSQSPILTAIRFGQFARDTGIDGHQILTSALCAVPVPQYIEFEGRKRWEGTKVDLMWHPLMWLPESLARPQKKVFNDQEYVEPFDAWMVRLCIELETSGLYDPVSGTWIDVLAMAANLNIEDEMTQSRLRRWMDGARDDRLDGIDLTPHISNPADPEWSINLAAERFEELIVASWAVSSEALGEALDDLHDGEVSDVPVDNSDRPDTEYVWSPGERKAVASSIVALADAALEGASDFDWLTASEDILAFQGTDEELLEGPVAGVREYLAMIHQEFAPSQEDIDEATAMAEADAADEDDAPGSRRNLNLDGPTVEAAGDAFVDPSGRRGGMDVVG